MGLGEDAFTAATTPLRRELLAHCYRMLGSVAEAEDLVQETMLRAWRARAAYDPSRASVRTWLHRIATNACLTALDGRARRPLPSGLGPAADDPGAALTPAREIPWLQPWPGSAPGSGDDPGSARTAGIRLAFVASLQLLPPRQRAALVLRDVLDFSAAETAAQLGTTVAAVNSALQRARSTLATAGLDDERVNEPTEPTVRRTVDRYVAAFEAADVGGLVALLSADVVLEMPPVPLWYRGPADYGAFMARIFRARGDGWRMVRTTANDQPALAAYCPDGADRWVLHTLQVLTVTTRGVSRNVVFQDAEVFTAFALEPALVVDVDGRHQQTAVHPVSRGGGAETPAVR